MLLASFCSSLWLCSVWGRNTYKHYHLAMHVFGLMAQATTLNELDDIVRSTTVVFSSSCSGQEVEKHFHNLQTLTRAGPPEIDERGTEEENFVVGNQF